MLIFGYCSFANLLQVRKEKKTVFQVALFYDYSTENEKIGDRKSKYACILKNGKPFIRSSVMQETQKVSITKRETSHWWRYNATWRACWASKYSLVKQID